MTDTLVDLYHRPVLLAEVVALLAPRDGGVYLDGTVGGGGHAEALLRASAPGGRLVGVDRDPEAVAFAAARLAPYGPRARLFRAAFDELDAVDELRDLSFDGVLLDLGVSSRQIDEPRRGFTFDADAPLDMRMGGEGPTAEELLNEGTVEELAEILRRYGEEPFAGPIARAVVQARARGRITGSARLKEVLRSAVPAHFSPAKVYARAFQALRIAVNDELGRLDRALDDVFGRLAPEGRLAVIAYHSLEDRLVKRAFRQRTAPCVCPPQLPVCGCGRRATARAVTRRAVRPALAEVAENPRARSARLRVIARIDEPAAGGTQPRGGAMR